MQEVVVNLMTQAEQVQKTQEAEGGIKYEQLSWWGDDQTNNLLVV